MNKLKKPYAIFVTIIVITFLSTIFFYSCESKNQLTSPSSHAQIALNTVFMTSTPHKSKDKSLTFSSKDNLKTDQKAAHKLSKSSQRVDRVTVTVINSNNEAVIDDLDLDIVETAEGRFAEGNLNIPVNGDQETFLIDIKAFDDDNLVFAGNTLITLTPGEVRTEPVIVTLQALGGGDVQVTLTWNTATDQDLHVIDPSNTRIFFDNPSSPTGGTLDFDDTDGFGPENIFWPTGQAPSGLYKVQVVYFSGTGATVVTVVIQRSDAQAETFTRTINTEGDTLDITEFTFTAGNPILLSVAITPKDPTIDIGQTQQFNATGTSSDGSTSDITNQVTWESSDPDLASIAANGLATAQAPGTTTISATLNNLSDETTLTINAEELSGATLSNLQAPLVQLNDSTNCDVFDGPVGSLFEISFDYTDPDGDVTTGTVVNVTFTFQPSGSTGSFDVTSPGITGDGFQGTLSFGGCFVFGNESSLRLAVSITDAGNQVSNAISLDIQRPEGANSPPPGQQLRRSVMIPGVVICNQP